MLLNGTVPSSSYLGSADASGFYLGADLPSPGSIKMCVETFDFGGLDQLNFTPHVKTEPSGANAVHAVVSCAARAAWAAQAF